MAGGGGRRRRPRAKKKRRDPLAVVPEFGGLVLGWVSGREASSLAFVSKRWQREAMAEIGRRSQLEGAAALCSKSGASGLIRRLTARVSWRPNVCVVFTTPGGRRKASNDAAATALPRDCALVVVVGDGVIGPDDTGRNVEDDARGATSVLLLRRARFKLVAFPKHFTPETLFDRAVVAPATDRTGAVFFQPSSSKESDDWLGISTRVLERWCVDLCVGRWLAATAALEKKSEEQPGAPPQCFHVALYTGPTRSRHLDEGRHGECVGGMASKIYARAGVDDDDQGGGLSPHKGPLLQECADLFLTFFGPSRAISMAEGQGDDYAPDLEEALRRQGVAHVATHVAATKEPRTDDKEGLVPSFGVAVTCNMRGEDFHGAGDVEAQAHSRLLPEIPIAGFFATGEYGPLSPEANLGRFGDLGFTTCLGFVK